MKDDPTLHLYDPRNGDLSLKIEPFQDVSAFSQPQRTNYFTILWISEGSGTFWADLGCHPFGADSLLFLVPYQSFRLQPHGSIAGFLLHFHANFLCIETHHQEVGCNGVLFNDVYGTPVVQLDETNVPTFAALIGDMREELRQNGVARSEVLLSYLKIFLIRATRLKLEQRCKPSAIDAPRVPQPLAQLKELIEENFRALHAPMDYAKALHMSPKALARLVKTYHRKTLTELIRERITRQAKWELLHTLKPVKQVAGELGFEDVFYFSRLFKRATGCSPTFFREYETTIREGRNLSMQ